MKRTSLSIAAFLSIGLCLAQKKSGVKLEYLDKSIQPQNDFYQYTCGNWIKTNSIPETDPAWGSFNEIRDRNEKNILAILNEIAKDKNAPAGSNRQKIRDYYTTAMDSLKAEKLGLKPLKADLAAIDKVSTTNDLIKLMAIMLKKGVGNPFGFSIETDLKNSSTHAAYLSQSGYFLPDRDYYFNPKFEPIKVAYQKHIENMFKLSGNYPESAEAYAKVVLTIESGLASKAMNRVEMRNYEKQYNKMSLDEIQKKYPNLNFPLFFTTVGMSNPPKELIVGQPEFYAQLNDMLKTVSLKDWKTYLKWTLLHEASGYLNKAFVDEMFSFYGTTLSGIKTMKPRWKRSATAVDAALGEALGQLFVEKHFSADSKKKVNEMVDNLMAAYKERILSREWMSEETKKNAIIKLEKIIRKLGYPDVWKDYSKLTVKTDAYVLNKFRVNQFNFDYMLSKYGKPVDKKEWGMTPPTVNAYYNPTSNEIAFPAGIMQPPFFDPEADDAFNYGIMGSIIGHELTHGFDDNGATFDAEGNMVNWWTEADKKQFEARTGVLVKQFNNYIAIDTIHVNGKLTLGENIADLGGLTMAYYAYKKSLNGKKSEVMDGFTGEQRFFIAWAQGWKTLMRPEFLKQMVATNPHSPGNFRANGPLTNMPEFYEAFDVKEGNGMYRKKEERVAIW